MVIRGRAMGFALALFASAVGGCDRPRDGVILSFDADADFDRVVWTCPTAMEEADGLTGSGHALRAYLQPGPYPGVEIFDPPSNWRGYHAFEFLVSAPEAAGETLHIRVDDSESREDFGRRYEGTRIYGGGVQRVVIPLEEIRAMPVGRNLDLGRIRRIVIYFYKQDRPITLTLDDLRLVN